MITIPTCELVGVISDVLPFASTDTDYAAVNSVLVRWCGEHLHAEATNRYVIGRSWWRPGDDPDIDVQEELGVEWGGADDPWRVLLSLDDAKDIVTVFKLKPKEGWAALEVDLVDGFRRLKIVRRRETGHSAITQVIQGTDYQFPDLDKLIGDATLFSVPTAELAFNAKMLAGFAKVRQRGPVEFSFGGPNRMATVKIGTRFTGAIMPVRTAAPDETPPPPPPAGDLDEDVDERAPEFEAALV